MDTNFVQKMDTNRIQKVGSKLVQKMGANPAQKTNTDRCLFLGVVSCNVWIWKCCQLARVEICTRGADTSFWNAVFKDVADMLAQSHFVLRITRASCVWSEVLGGVFFWTLSRCWRKQLGCRVHCFVFFVAQSWERSKLNSVWHKPVPISMPAIWTPFFETQRFTLEVAHAFSRPSMQHVSLRSEQQPALCHAWFCCQYLSTTISLSCSPNCPLTSSSASALARALSLIHSLPAPHPHAHTHTATFLISLSLTLSHTLCFFILIPPNLSPRPYTLTNWTHSSTQPPAWNHVCWIQNCFIEQSRCWAREKNEWRNWLRHQLQSLVCLRQIANTFRQRKEVFIFG